MRLLPTNPPGDVQLAAATVSAQMGSRPARKAPSLTVPAQGLFLLREPPAGAATAQAKAEALRR